MWFHVVPCGAVLRAVTCAPPHLLTLPDPYPHPCACAEVLYKYACPSTMKPTQIAVPKGSINQVCVHVCGCACVHVCLCVSVYVSVCGTML